MRKKIFPYKETPSRIFETVKRPLLDIEIYSNIVKRYVLIRGILADPGADISLFPDYIGDILLEDYTAGKSVEFQGVVPGMKLRAYLHTLKMRFNGAELNIGVAIAASPRVPLLFGRVQGLDFFEVCFVKGKYLTIKG